MGFGRIPYRLFRCAFLEQKMYFNVIINFVVNESEHIPCNITDVTFYTYCTDSCFLNFPLENKQRFSFFLTQYGG